MDEQPQNDGRFDALKNELAKEYVAQRYFHFGATGFICLFVGGIFITLGFQAIANGGAFGIFIAFVGLLPLGVLYLTFRQFRIQQRIAKMNSSDVDE